MRDELLTKSTLLPTSSGVYLFRDRQNQVIYVGKAKNLRARVRQYLLGQDERFMVPFLVHHAHEVDVVITSTEKEALILENSLIKKYLPRYNTQLRDDKNFLQLRINRNFPWPSFQLVRRVEADQASYFGPYTSARQARQTLAVLGKYFPLRTCSDQVLNSRKRPCILYQMKRCTAPCVGYVTTEEYDAVVDDAMLFLEGKHHILIERLTNRMESLAEAEKFEDAARARDVIRAIQATLEQQMVVDLRLGDRDVWGIYREGIHGVVTLLPIRYGLMGEPRPSANTLLPGEDSELLSSLLNEAYPAGIEIPAEILVPVLPEDVEALTEVLSERAGKAIQIIAPTLEKPSRLIDIANDNARASFIQRNDVDARRQSALVELAKLLSLPRPPHRIECFDNSNIGGEHPVAAMAVLIDGKPTRSEYRRYRIKTVVGANDFASMAEILNRRVQRGLRENNLPDLLVVDGGRGQVSAAKAVLEELGVNIPLVGIRKPRTEHGKGNRGATDAIVVPHIKDALTPRTNDPALRLLQLVRDEVHEHAIKYHRKVRQKSTISSALDGISGVGASRRKLLLKTLGSAQAVLEASVETLAVIPGIGPKLALHIYQALHPNHPDL